MSEQNPGTEPSSTSEGGRDVERPDEPEVPDERPVEIDDPDDGDRGRDDMPEEPLNPQ